MITGMISVITISFAKSIKSAPQKWLLVSKASLELVLQPFAFLGEVLYKDYPALSSVLVLSCMSCAVLSHLFALSCLPSCPSSIVYALCGLCCALLCVWFCA